MRFRVWDAVAGAYSVLFENRQRLFWVILFWALFILLLRVVIVQLSGLLANDASSRQYGIGSALAEWGAGMSAWICVCLASQRFVILGEDPRPIPTMGNLLVSYSGYLCLAVLPYAGISYFLDFELPNWMPGDAYLVIWAASGCLYLCVTAPFVLPLAAVAAGKPSLSPIESYRLTRSNIFRLVLGVAACVVPVIGLQFLLGDVLTLLDVPFPGFITVGVQSVLQLGSYAIWVAYISFAYLHFTRAGRDKEDGEGNSK